VNKIKKVLILLLFSICGYGEIEEGRKAGAEDFLDVVGLVKDSKIKCTGTLLTSNIVISAKHCNESEGIYRGDGTNLKGREGRQLKLFFKRSKNYSKIKDIVEIRKNDVAFYLIDKPLEKQNKIKVLTGSNAQILLEDSFFVSAGFGVKKQKCDKYDCNAMKTIFDDMKIRTECLGSPVALKIPEDIERVDEKCDAGVYRNMILFKESKDGKKLLGGDSGAGIFLENNNSYTLVSVHSRRANKKKTVYNKSDMYTNIVSSKMYCDLKKKIKRKSIKSNNESYYKKIYKQIESLGLDC